MHSRVLGWLFLFVVGAVAADAPAVDRKDPAAVAKAYQEAIDHRDITAAQALVAPDKAVGFMLHLVAAQSSTGPFSTSFWNALALFPVAIGPLQLTPAGPAGADTATFDLRGRVELSPKLILKKQPDGNWAVDLRASLTETLGKDNPMLAQILPDQVASLPDATADQAEANADNGLCWQKMWMLRSAMDSYVREHGDKYPLADIWTDALAPYLEGDRPFRCPGHPKEEFSYAFNAALSEKPPIQDWMAGRQTPMFICTDGDLPNATFKVDDVGKLKARHGKLVPLLMANSEQRVLLAGTSLTAAQAAEKQREACESRLRALAEAARQYAKAHDGRLPAAATWTDDLRGLVKKPQDGGNPFACPSAADAKCTYAINQDLAGKPLAELVNWRKHKLFIEIGPCEPNTAVPTGRKAVGPHVSMWDPGEKPFGQSASVGGDVDHS